MNKNIAQRISRLIKETLSTPPKEDKCNCGCHSCENVGNPGPVLNENLGAKIIMTENMQYHVNNKLALTENTFRYGSEAFLNLWAEARYLHSHNAIHVNELDKELITETDLGEYGIYEGKKVPLDLILEENSELGGKEDVEFTTSVFMLPYIELLKAIEKDYGVGDVYLEIEQAIFDKDIKKIPDILRRYELDKEYSHLTRVNEADKKKQPALGKPKRGGSKKFYVYVRKPGGGVKKVSFGMAGGGLRAKLNNPKARQAFAKRHKCAQAKDRTTPRYWSCRLPRYAKLLGFKTTFSGYW
jgi:hypothetical protein